MDPRIREDDGAEMDPRIREDDALEIVIPAEPALDLIGGQESIPESIPASGRRLVQRAFAQVLYIGPAHQ